MLQVPPVSNHDFYVEAFDLKGMLLSKLVVDKGNTDILCFLSYHRRVGSRGLQSFYLLSPLMKLHGGADS